MKSVKEINLETKILNKLKGFPTCTKLANYLFDDLELQCMQDYANNVSIKRLGFNDHGPVHMRQAVNNAIKMLNLLHANGIKTSLEKEEIGSFEDSMCAIVLAGLAHDLGMMIGRANHEEMSAILAIPILDRALLEVFPNSMERRIVIKSLALEAIVGHMSQRKIHSIEAGVILVADGCDMTRGRARISLALTNSPKPGDIHKYSAGAIKSVKIRQGDKKPIKITVEMTGEVGFFQIEEVLLTKVASSPVKEYIELYACVTGDNPKCYLQ